MGSEHHDRNLNSPDIRAEGWAMLHRFFWSHRIHLNFLALLKSTQQQLRLHPQALVHNTLFAVARLFSPPWISKLFLRDISTRLLGTEVMFECTFRAV